MRNSTVAVRLISGMAPTIHTHSARRAAGESAYFSFDATRRSKYAASLDCSVVLRRGTGVQLTRPADLHLGIGHHLLPVCNPACRAGDGEHDGEHGARNSQSAVDDSGIEVDVGIELA